MSNQNNNTESGGIGFLGLLTIVFITLKLMGYISWSWWWVLAPLWVIPALVIGVCILFFIFGIFAEILKSK